MQDDAISVCTARGHDHRRGHNAAAQEIEANPARNIKNDLVTADAFAEGMDLVPSMLASRAALMFTNGVGQPTRSKEPALAAVATRWLLKLAKDAVSELFELQREEVQRSWGTLLDQEEALGYLVADSLGAELLPDEARAVGVKARKRLTAAKGSDDKVRGLARARRARARKAAEKNGTTAHELALQISEIDAEMSASLAEHWGAEVEIGLPQGRIAVVPAPRPTGVARAAAAADKGVLAQAEAKLAAAKAAKVQAEAAHVAARRAVEELMPPGFNGDRCYAGLRSWVREVLYTDEQEAREAVLKQARQLPSSYRRACAAARHPPVCPPV